MSDDASVAATARAASDPSIVVNNAGVALGTPLLGSPLADIREELETNLFGMIRVAHAFAPTLRVDSTSSLVNVLSAASWLALGDGYSISKAAAWSATNSMRTYVASALLRGATDFGPRRARGAAGMGPAARSG